MKTKITAILIATASLAHANLIDLTPGGFSFSNEPPAYVEFVQLVLRQGTILIAGANISGNQVDWSPYTLFGPANFGISPNGASANTTWNLTDTEGYFMQYILVDGIGTPDQITEHLYGVTGGTFKFDGEALVIIDGQLAISSISFFGSNLVPDGGWTLALFAIALSILLMTRRFIHFLPIK